MFWRSHFESLEDRRLMSVSATLLTGPLTTGTERDYRISIGGHVAGNTVSKIVGSATVNGVATKQLNTTGTVSGHAINTQAFIALNSHGFVEYKTVGKSSISGLTVTTTDTFTPYDTIFPTSLTAGHTYTFHWTDKTVTKIGTHTTTSTSTETFTIKLLSSSTTHVTVPAGTFSCYEFQESATITSNGHTSTTHSTLYDAANVGPVKTVTGTGSTQSVSVLTKFHKG